jgi:hypothetical protein
VTLPSYENKFTALEVFVQFEYGFILAVYFQTAPYIHFGFYRHETLLHSVARCNFERQASKMIQRTTNRTDFKSSIIVLF